MRKFFRKCPLIAVIIASVVIITVVALVGAVTGKYQFIIKMDHPLFASILNDEKVEKPEESKESAEKEEKKKEAEKKEDNQSTQEEIDNAKPGDILTIGHARYMVTEMKKARSGYYYDNNRIALSSDLKYKKVKKSYFDDTAFMGDSRVEGLKYYGDLGEADFFDKVGLNVFKLMDETIKCKDGNMTIPQALKKKKYKNIYIMVGVNELGIGSPDKYRKAYKENIETIKRLQPDAKIFIMSTMHVSKKYSDKGDVVNNDNINVRNCEVASLCDGKQVFYLNVNECIDTENGNMKGRYTNDGVHLKAQYYSLWVDWLKEHAV